MVGSRWLSGATTKSMVDAITRTTKREGVTSLWRGSSLTVNRAMLVMAPQLSSYDQIKETILEKGVMRDGLGTQVTASFAAGAVELQRGPGGDLHAWRQSQPGKHFS